ncbi:MAG: MFS transporter [Acidobacteriaceae bacterium]
MDISSSDTLTADQQTRGWQFAVGAAILGWVLDAFDFFVVIFLFDTLAANFDVGKLDIVYTLTLTLAMRPVGALIFGSLADRYGRKRPMIFCVLFFSAITILSGFAPNYLFFLVMRGLYGVGMGGYWGIGASYAMESAPRSRRGVLSGLMQAGYPFGYLLAAVAMQTLVPDFGWRSMFMVGTSVTVLIVILTLFAPESESWKLHRQPSLEKIFRAFFQHIGIFAYLLLVMVAMSCLSHGTQDLYPDFLKSIPKLMQRKILGMHMLFGIPVIYNIGAILGALIFGHISEKIGRRRSIMFALTVSLLSIPAWAFGSSLLTLVLGSYFMQAGVQGAFGVIPAHLNELSPDSVRSLFPGFVYQFGVLIASPAVSFEYVLRDHLGYPWALTGFEFCTIIALLFIFGFGPERLSRNFYFPDGSLQQRYDPPKPVQERATLKFTSRNPVGNAALCATAEESAETHRHFSRWINRRLFWYRPECDQ